MMHFRKVKVLSTSRPRLLVSCMTKAPLERQITLILMLKLEDRILSPRDAQ